MHPNPIALLSSSDSLYGCTKVAHIQFTAQSFRQRRVQKIDNQSLAFLPQVNPDLAIGKVDHNTPSPIGATTKIHIPQRQSFVIAILRKQCSDT